MFFGLRDITLLSGTTVPLLDGVVRVAGVVAYVGLSMTGLVAVGLFFSTLTEVPVGAMAATVVVAIVSGVLDQLPALHVDRARAADAPLARVRRVPAAAARLGACSVRGMALQAAWVAIFGALAWSRFTTADVSS